MILVFFCGLNWSQEPIFEIKPYQPPEFEQYPIKAHVDHHFPSQIVDGVNVRLDGFEFTEDIIAFGCTHGTSCYDGHAGVDYYMPENTPILAPAPGNVIWSEFSPGADPCPGGMEPNGLTGIIILAHGNGYYSCYLHLNPPLNVVVGETVMVGDTLGFEGMTGCADQPHLHFEIRKGSWFFDQENPWVIDPFGWWGNNEDPIFDLRGNQSHWLWKSSGLIDDGDNGFQRYFGPDWNYLNTGYNGDSWIAPTVTDIDESRHYAMWVPEIDESGEYKIEVYIPDGYDVSTSALYEIYVKDQDGNNEKTIIPYDQTSNTGTFATLTTMDIPQGSNCAVILRDFVDNNSDGTLVLFDAIRFSSANNLEIITVNNSGWNLVGLPVNMINGYVSNVFPNAVEGTLYQFSNTYELAEDLAPGNGYWLYFQDPDSNLITGAPITNVSISLSSGWNLISGISEEVTIANISDPDGIIVPGTLYGFSETYYNTTVMTPGKGYWIGAFSDGNITISNSRTAKTTFFNDLTDQANKLTINGRELYFGVSVPENEILRYQLPPKPPQDVFDIRFSDNMKMVESSGIIDLTNYFEKIIISYVINIELEENLRWILTLDSGYEYELKDMGEIIIDQNITNLTLKKVFSKLLEYDISQNYPNPFNSGTSINYNISKKDNVLISIYNARGQKIKNLLNEIIVPGNHNVYWDGTDLNGYHVTSGIYIYTISSGTQFISKKMVLIK